MTTLYIGLDDTDSLTSRGTGHLARAVANSLAAEFTLLGVTRHQLLFDPRIPCTAKNSCAAILLDVSPAAAANGLLPRIVSHVRDLMLADFVLGSDPGLCVVAGVPSAFTDFGRRAQCELVTQAEARTLAQAHGVALLGLGGDEDGVIGALAAVGLAATGEDGRYVLAGTLRELAGLHPVDTVLAAGIDAVQTPDGAPVTQGQIQTDKLRPARRGGRPVAVVEWNGDHWLPLKLD